MSPFDTLPTRRQRDVLQAIAEYRLTHEYGPSIRELGATLGIGSTNAVNDHLRLLERKGLLARDSRIGRSLRLTHAGLAHVAGQMLRAASPEVSRG